MIAFIMVFLTCGTLMALVNVYASRREVAYTRAWNHLVEAAAILSELRKNPYHPLVWNRIRSDFAVAFGRDGVGEVKPADGSATAILDERSLQQFGDRLRSEDTVGLRDWMDRDREARDAVKPLATRIEAELALCLDAWGHRERARAVTSLLEAERRAAEDGSGLRLAPQQPDDSQAPIVAVTPGKRQRTY